MANKTTSNWDGSPLTLAVNDSANMPQTTNGSMVFAYQNSATLNNAGTLSLTSGGNVPQSLFAPALANQPSILVNNWQANNLNILNISANSATPIWIEAFGPGLPGIKPIALPIGATTTLTTLGADLSKAVAQGTASPNYMQIVLSSNTPNLTIAAIVGGPVDATGNNAYVVAVNSPAGDTGPGTGAPAPAGYFATRGGNSYTYQFNWGSSTIFVANMSPSTAAAASVTLRSL